MTVHERQKPPAGHGEVLCTPPFEEWAALVARNARAVDAWPEELRALRGRVRADSVAESVRFSASLGLPPGFGWSGGPIVMTGHQPELYHPGVWVKDFLLERLAQETGALGIDIVVDTDLCEGVTLRAPCLRPTARVCEVPLVAGGPDVTYAQLAAPDAADRAVFREAGLMVLSSLPAPALRRHFATFCDALDATADGSPDLGTLMTAARRCYESSAGTTYLEILASAQSRLPSFREFASALLADAGRLRRVVNSALADYRARTGTRSAAQPFPDLTATDDRIEVPFWLLVGGRRLPASVDAEGTLYGDGQPIASLGTTAASIAATLSRDDLLLVPRALALTLFQRLFLADLFIHGTGGGRYDRVTDAVIAEYYGIEPPAFVVASMTLLLPLGARTVTDEEVTSVEQRLHRFEHNPDSVLAEVEFDTTAEREYVEALVRRKAEAVAAISAPGADRKTLGGAIRELNSELTELLEPVRRDLEEELALVRAERDASGVLTDRTYPYCLWDPREVMDKVR